MSDLWKRSISGLLFVVVLTGCIFIHPICFFVLFFILNIVSLLEFIRLAEHLNVFVNKILVLLCGSVLFISGFLHTQWQYEDGFLIFFILTFIMSISEIYRKKGLGFRNIAFSFYSLLYISVPFTMLIYFPYMISGEWTPLIIFLPFLLIWLNDTFAYIFGVNFGKHKLFPRISPKKTWEGFIGGAIFTMATGIIIAPYIEDVKIIDTLIISTIVIIFGTFGDLLESMFKRNIEIKDSGNFLPGHGGVLDRFDAIIFTIPAIFVYLRFMY